MTDLNVKQSQISEKILIIIIKKKLQNLDAFIRQNQPIHTNNRKNVIKSSILNINI